MTAGSISPTPFLSKTYTLVDDHSTDEIISWNKDGSSFIVWDPTQFAKILLPKYFKHDNFSSFIRQLNTYQFRKIVPDRWEFSNENFQRGKKHLLGKISRRKSVITASPEAPPLSEEEQGNNSSSICSSGDNLELIEENERLRNENSKLSKELSEIRSLFQNIISQTKNYASNCRLPEQSSPPPPASMKPLDLLPVEREEESSDSTKLFGVRIGGKRQKIISGCGEWTEVYGCPELQLGQFSAV